MKTRIISAAVGILFVVLLMIFGEKYSILFAIAFALACAIACVEFLTARKLQKNPLVMVTTLLFAIAMPLVALTNVFYLPVYTYSLLMFAYMIFLRDKLNIKDVTFAYAGISVIACAFGYMSRLVVSSGGWHSFYLIIALVSPWCADSAAYFAGSFLGKRKLCPQISPKKTVEGAIGGAFGSIICTLLAGLIFQFLVYRNITVNYLALLVIGVFCAFVSVIGDLIFSVIKRDCGIKDYGSIMPGHGGILDRVDSVIFCVPFTYLISDVWGLISAI
ncbi:MAG: phosphatidate cytidylyltransferase [Ruminococcus sp.]|nr:phosphatidate cytidylyltransferase [Ruminococcus sp.]